MTSFRSWSLAALLLLVMGAGCLSAQEANGPFMMRAFYASSPDGADVWNMTLEVGTAMDETGHERPALILTYKLAEGGRIFAREALDGQPIRQTGQAPCWHVDDFGENCDLSLLAWPQGYFLEDYGLDAILDGPGRKGPLVFGQPVEMNITRQGDDIIVGPPPEGQPLVIEPSVNSYPDSSWFPTQVRVYPNEFSPNGYELYRTGLIEQGVMPEIPAWPDLAKAVRAPRQGLLFAGEDEPLVEGSPSPKVMLEKARENVDVVAEELENGCWAWFDQKMTKSIDSGGLLSGVPVQRTNREIAEYRVGIVHDGVLSLHDISWTRSDLPEKDFFRETPFATFENAPSCAWIEENLWPSMRLGDFLDNVHETIGHTDHDLRVAMKLEVWDGKVVNDPQVVYFWWGYPAHVPPDGQGFVAYEVNLHPQRMALYRVIAHPSDMHDLYRLLEEPT